MNDLGPRTDFFGRMERLTVRVTAPDGCARAVYTTTGGVFVELRPEAIKTHTDQSLGAAVTAAVRGVLTGYRQAISRFLRDEGAAGPGYDTSDARQVERARTFAERVGAIHVKVVSPRGYAKSEVTPEIPEFTVGVRPGTLERIDVSAEVLTAELNDVISRGLTEHRRAREEEHKRLYEIDYLNH